MPESRGNRESKRCGALLLLAGLLALAVPRAAQAQHWALGLESPQAGGLTAFAARSDGTFFACEVNGNDAAASWTATSHGKPGLGATGEASMHFHSTNTDLYVFTRTASGNLYLRSAPSAFNNPSPAWSWTNLGKPSSATIASDPASVSYGGKEYAFVIGSDQHLYVAYGPPWAWSDQGTPTGVTLVGRPSALVFDDKLYAFVIGSDGQLYTRYWNGAWNWVSLGTPPSGALLQGSTAAATRGNTIHVFAGGSDQHVYIRYWDGGAWQWSDQGSAPIGIGVPAAAWLEGQNGKTDLYAFALRYLLALPGVIQLPKLLENHWSSVSGWHLTGHGSPAPPLLYRQPAITAAFGGPIETWPTWRVSVMLHATSDRIVRRMWAPIGGVWQWSWPAPVCQM
jgi:hypothetical protein